MRDGKRKAHRRHDHSNTARPADVAATQPVAFTTFVMDFALGRNRFSQLYRKCIVPIIGIVCFLLLLHAIDVWMRTA